MVAILPWIDVLRKFGKKYLKSENLKKKGFFQSLKRGESIKNTFKELQSFLHVEMMMYRSIRQLAPEKKVSKGVKNQRKYLLNPVKFVKKPTKKRFFFKFSPGPIGQ